METAQVGTVEHGPTIKNGTCAILCQSVGTAKVPEFQPYINKTTNVPLFFIYVFIFCCFCVVCYGHGTAQQKRR